jgi:flagellar basal-body rod protein FlgF
MAGSQYIALSGMRSRLDQLDRLSSDIANAGTAGYKAERSSDAESDRPQFEAVFQTAVDVTDGGRRMDVRPGTIAGTGRDLDVAIEGKGYFSVQTPGGTRYTRNGHFSVDANGTLVTGDGAPVLGASGPIAVGKGNVSVDQDGTVHAGETVAGKLAVVDLDAAALTREGSSLFRADGAKAQPIAQPIVRGGALEQSNVSVVDRIAELTSVSRSFEALQKAVSLVMNDIDGRAIDAFRR